MQWELRKISILTNGEENYQKDLGIERVNWHVLISIFEEELMLLAFSRGIFSKTVGMANHHTWNKNTFVVWFYVPELYHFNDSSYSPA